MASPHPLTKFMRPESAFSAMELRVLRSLRTPARIQKFLDELGYNHGNTAYSPRATLRHGKAHCLEGAVLAAAALWVNGQPPLIWDLEAVNDDDHVLALFRVGGYWGAVAKSNYAGLRYREPIHRNLRELAVSYFDSYFNLRGERTLRRYSRAVDMRRFNDQDWLTTDLGLWFVADHLGRIAHSDVVPSRVQRRLVRVDRRSFAAGLYGRSSK